MDPIRQRYSRLAYLREQLDLLDLLGQQVVTVLTVQLARLEPLVLLGLLVQLDLLARLGLLEVQGRLALLDRMETSVVQHSVMTGIPTLPTPTHRQVMSKQTTQRLISLLHYTLTIQTRMEQTFNPS